MFSATPFGASNQAAHTNPGGSSSTQPTATSGATSTSGGLFGNLTGPSSTPQANQSGLFGNAGNSNTQPKPSGTSLFGNTPAGGGGGLFGGSKATTSQPQSTGLFTSTATTSQPQSTGLFTSTATASQPQSTGLFSTTAGAGAGNTTQGGGSSLFGNLGNASTTQAQPKSFFGGTPSTTGGGLFGGNQSTAQQQQPQKPTLSLFGNQTTTQQQQSTTGPSVIPGVRVDLTNLLPTTKFESCADEIRSELEKFDNYVLSQIHMCHEVANLLPNIESQASTIPYDVEFIQGKLDTMQHALENDAHDIDRLRSLVSRDAAEAQVGFRAIDTLQLPVQYQSTASGGWWPGSGQSFSDRQSFRSTRKNTLALPDAVESDSSATTAINGVPVNLVDYFALRSDEMSTVLNKYTQNLKEIEDHLHGLEATLNRQINDFVASRGRDSIGAGSQKRTLDDLTAVLGDVEAGILGVANRLGTVTEQAQELVLGPPS